MTGVLLANMRVPLFTSEFLLNHTPVFVFVCISMIIETAVVHASQPVEEPTAIVLVSLSDCCSDRVWSDGENAIAEELKLLGMQVSVIAGRDLEDNAQAILNLEAIDNDLGGIVAITISRESGNSARVKLWFQHSKTNQHFIREIGVDDVEATDAVAVVALKTIDTLRAGLYEMLELQRSDENKSSPSDAQLSQEDDKDKESFSTPVVGRIGVTLEGGLGVMGTPDSPGGLRAGFYVEALWRPITVIGISLEGSLLPFGKSVSNADATSELSFFSIRGWLSGYLLRNPHLLISLSLGGGAVLFMAEGVSGSVPLSKEHTWVGYVGSGFKIQPYITRYLFFSFSGKVGITGSKLELLHVDSTVASLGRPMLELSLGVGINF